MLTPLKLTEIPITARNYVRSSLWLLWREALLLALGGVGLALASVPVWYVLTHSGHVPVASLLALLGPIPLWTALCYPLGRAVAGRSARLGDAGKALWLGYVRILLLALPVLLALNLSVRASSLLAPETPWLVQAGVTVNFGVTLVLGLITLFALPALILFDLPATRAWMYGMALALRWPLVSLSALVVTVLLVMASRGLGAVGWILTPWLLLPFTVTATLMLMRRGYERELAQRSAAGTD